MKSDRQFRPLIYGLISLSNLMRGNQERFAAYIGVSVPQYMMMIVLEDAPGSSVREIASRVEVSSQFVTLEIGRLVDKGLVEKRDSEADRRSVLLNLSSAGQALMSELAPLRRRTNDLMFGSLSGEQTATLHEIVATLLADGRNARHQLEAPDWRNQRAPSLQSTGRSAGRPQKKRKG